MKIQINNTIINYIIRWFLSISIKIVKFISDLYTYEKPKFYAIIILIINICLLSDRFNILTSDELYHVKNEVIDVFECTNLEGDTIYKVKVYLPEYNLIKMDTLINKGEFQFAKIGQTYYSALTKAGIYDSWFYSGIMSGIIIVSIFIVCVSLLISYLNEYL